MLLLKSTPAKRGDAKRQGNGGKSKKKGRAIGARQVGEKDPVLDPSSSLAQIFTHRGDEISMEEANEKPI